MSEGKFSYFSPPIYNTTPSGVLSLEEVWKFISGREKLEVSRVHPKTGDIPTRIGTLQDVTRTVRSMSPERYSDKEEGKTYYLPMVLFGGIFSKRDGNCMEEASGYINLDIDHISGLKLDLLELKDRLSKDREIGLRLLFTSPSGDGLKLVCKTSGEITNKESYKEQFQILNSFVSRKYDIPIGNIGLDKAISDITRGCFLCYDPEAVFLDQGEDFHPEAHPIPEEYVKPSRKRQDSPSYLGTDWDSWEENRLTPAIFDRVPEIFPEMNFRNTRKGWASPLKLDGSPAKNPRTEKTVITTDYPDCILEQGLGAFNIISFWGAKRGLSRSESRRELARICGLEEEERELSRNYAQMKEREEQTRYQGGRDLQPVPGPNSDRTPEERFAKYLETPDLREIMSVKREGIETGYLLKNPQGREEKFTLQSDSLNLICGQSSHGKTKFLLNLALDIAKKLPDTGEESVLFFAFEEDVAEITLQFANLHTNIKDLSQYGTKNLEVLLDYYQTGHLNKAPEARRREAIPKLEEFNSILEKGKLRIYYTPDTYSGELCEIIRYISSKIKIKAVFMDYVQAIYKENCKTERRVELREICKEIHELAKEIHIPVVLSAQLNRQTPNPTSMSSDNIAESADITRYANVILLLWNSAFVNDVKDKDSYLASEDYKRRLLPRGFDLNKEGKLFCHLTKNRFGIPYPDMILDFTGETGYIAKNEDLPPVPGEETGVLDFD